MLSLKNTIRLLMIVALFAATPVYTQSKAPSKTTKKELSADDLRLLQKKISSSAHLAVDFTQSRYSTIRERTVKSKGSALFSKPNKFRWRLESPLPSEWIFDGKKLYNYSPSTKQAVKYNAGAQMQQLTHIVDLVMNFETLLERYTLIKATDSGNKISVSLKPNHKANLSGVDLVIDKKRNFISQLKLDLPEGVHTLDFSKPVREKIANAAYSVPAGTKVTEAI